MREIKFRQFISGAGFHYWGVGIDGATFTGPPTINNVKPRGEHQQFIGLLDKNGKEIYEGDVLDVKLYDWSRADSVIARENVVMQFSDGCFGFEWGVRKEFTRVKDFSLATFEIIGNIHETPDLLEV